MTSGGVRNDWEIVLVAIIRNSVVLCALLLAHLAGQARAVTLIDVDPTGAPLPAPEFVSPDNSPVYITNSNADGDPGAATVETLRVGAYSNLHLGYGDTDAATGGVALSVTGDMTVRGGVWLGKDATSGQPERPDAATTRAVAVRVGGALEVEKGGAMVLNGAGDGTDEPEHSTVAAGSVLIHGGSVVLEEFSVLSTTGTGTGPSVTVRDGGRLHLDGGLPPVAVGPDPAPDWAFKGVDVSAGGDGVLVGRGGVLAVGSSGGVVNGAAAQSLEVAKGGMIDAGGGDVLVTGMNNVVIDGGYRAGWSGVDAATTGMTAKDGRIAFGSGASISLTRELARHLNRSGTDAFADAVIARGTEIAFAGGEPTVLRTGMGTYSTVIRTTVPAEGETPMEYLRLGGVENAVLGNRTAGDRAMFHRNMADIWRGTMNAEQSANIYNLTAAETASVAAYGEAGLLNKAVLEAFVDGRNQPTGTGGVADDSLFEMYNAGAQWGVNTVAHNTAGEFMAGLNNRVHRLGAEMDRLGENWISSDYGYASCANPDLFENRLWAGAFGRNEEADLDYGIAGYKYRPRGFMTGYDKLFASGALAVGGAFAFGRGDYEDHASAANDSKITSYSVGLYGAYHGQSGLNLSGFATYSHLDNDLSDLRGGMRRTADHSSYAWSLGARGGYDMYVADRVLLSPSVGITRVRAVNRSHDEFLDGTGVLRVGEVRRDSTLAPVDLTLGFDVVKNAGAVLRLTGHAGYAYDFNDGGLDGMFAYDGLAGATSMAVAQRKPGRNRYNLGAGFVFTGRRLDLGARYDYFKRSEQKTHQASGSLGLKF